MRTYLTDDVTRLGGSPSSLGFCFSRWNSRNKSPSAGSTRLPLSAFPGPVLSIHQRGRRKKKRKRNCQWRVVFSESLPIFTRILEPLSIPSLWRMPPTSNHQLPSFHFMLQHLVTSVDLFVQLFSRILQNSTIVKIRFSANANREEFKKSKRLPIRIEMVIEENQDSNKRDADSE